MNERDEKRTKEAANRREQGRQGEGEGEKSSREVTKQERVMVL